MGSLRFDTYIMVIAALFQSKSLAVSEVEKEERGKRDAVAGAEIDFHTRRPSTLLSPLLPPHLGTTVGGGGGRGSIDRSPS